MVGRPGRRAGPAARAGPDRPISPRCRGARGRACGRRSAPAAGSVRQVENAGVGRSLDLGGRSDRLDPFPLHQDDPAFAQFVGDAVEDAIRYEEGRLARSRAPPWASRRRGPESPRRRRKTRRDDFRRACRAANNRRRPGVGKRRGPGRGSRGCWQTAARAEGESWSFAGDGDGNQCIAGSAVKHAEIEGRRPGSTRDWHPNGSDDQWFAKSLMSAVENNTIARIRGHPKGDRGPTEDHQS